MASFPTMLSHANQAAVSVPKPTSHAEFEKYLKFLCFKAVQIIVEARLGRRVSTPSKPNCFGSDWFNLALNDLPEVRTETKSALGGTLPSPGNSLCVEISLKTSDGDVMTLECWSLSVEENSPNSSPTSLAFKSAYHVYNRMSTLLKSIVVATRSTPAYRISRRQGSDSYVICYRVYMGQPELDSLGPKVKQAKMGPISSPIGTVSMGVSYRTRLTLSPHKLERSAPVMVKSDHFEAGPQSGSSPKSAGIHRADEGRLSDKNLGWFENRQALFARKNYAAFVDYGPEDAPAPEYLIPDLTASFPWIAESSAGAGPAKPNAVRPVPKPQAARKPVVSSATERQSMASSESPPPEDFVVVPSPPFASKEPDGDLGTFFHAIQTPTPLLSAFDDQIESVEDQLASLEVDREEFDSFISELATTTSST